MLDLANIQLNDTINKSSLLHLQRSLFDLMQVKYEGVVSISIDNQGGDLDYAWEIYNLLQQYDERQPTWEFITIGVGRIYSAASIPYLVVDKSKRWLSKEAEFLIHEPSVVSVDTGIRYNSKNLYEAPIEDQDFVIKSYTTNRDKLAKLCSTSLSVDCNSFTQTYLSGGDFIFSPEKLFELGWISYIGDPRKEFNIIHNYALL